MYMYIYMYLGFYFLLSFTFLILTFYELKEFGVRKSVLFYLYFKRIFDVHTVQDKATLEDSLELFVAEELFSGDNKLEDPDAGVHRIVLYCIVLYCFVSVLHCIVSYCIVLVVSCIVLYRIVLFW